jgi:hypothetical protein
MLLNTLSTASTSSVVAVIALTVVALSAGTASCSRSLHLWRKRRMPHQPGQRCSHSSRCRTASYRMSARQFGLQCKALLNLSGIVTNPTFC